MVSASRAIDTAAVLIEQLRQAVYQLEEERHCADLAHKQEHGHDLTHSAPSQGVPVSCVSTEEPAANGHPSSHDVSANDSIGHQVSDTLPPTRSALDTLMIELDGKLQETSRAFLAIDQELEKLPKGQSRPPSPPQGLTTHPSTSSTSLASLASATSFDDELWAAGDISGDVSFGHDQRLPGSADKRALRALHNRAQKLEEAWSRLQDEVEMVRRELVEDKQQRAFAGVVSHAHELMDSLSRALDAQDEMVHDWPAVETACSSAVATSSDPDESGSGMLDLESALTRAKTYGTELASVGRKTDVKLSYYVPSVQRAFSGLGAMLHSRATAHGGAERMRLAAVKRWEALSERAACAGRERRRIAQAHRFAVRKMVSAATTNPEADSALTAAANAATAVAADVSADLSSSFSSPLADSSTSPSSSIAFPTVISSSPSDARGRTKARQDDLSGASSPTPPRTSALPSASDRAKAMRGLSSSPQTPHAPNTSDQTALPPLSGAPPRPPRSLRRVSDVSSTLHSNETLTPSPASRSLGRGGLRTSGATARDPTNALTRTFDRLALDSKESISISPSSSTSRLPTGSNGRGTLGLSLTRSIYDDTPPHTSLTTSASTNGTSPVSSTSGETATTATSATSTGGRTPIGNARRFSRIPRLTSSFHLGNTPSRPSSTRPPSAMNSLGSDSNLSTSNARGAHLWRPPSAMNLLGSDGNLPTSSATGAHLSRPPSSLGSSSNNTPRSRPRGPPPPSRSAHAALSVRGAPRSVTQTPDPLIAQRAQSLSAFHPVRHAAPSPVPGSASGSGTVSGARSKLGEVPRRSSLLESGNRPSSRATQGRPPSTRPPSRIRPASRLEGPTYGEGVGGTYAPNTLDALDVSVGSIANALGVSIARLEPPLPRGQRLLLGPGKEVHARYALAGRPVTCKMLELHRPGATVQGPKTTRKTMVRAEGFWQDLETWLLSRLE